MYKVLLIKNRIKKAKLTKGLEYFKDKGIDISVEEITTDFEISFRNISNNTFSGVIADNYYNELRKIVPEGKYNCVCLMYGNKPKGIRVSVCEDYPLYPDTDVVQVVKDDDGKTFNHELFHAFFKKLARKGIKLLDPLDVAIFAGKSIPYFNNNNLKAKISNRTLALDELKPYWNAIVAMNQPEVVTLTRYSDNGVQTIGTLTYKDFKCDTLELAWKDNQKNISCIPKGLYTVKQSFSPKFMKNVYQVQNVFNRSGILLHKGNFFFDIQGCILLGSGFSDINKDGQMDVLNSTVIVSKFESIMQGKSFTLIIK